MTSIQERATKMVKGLSDKQVIDAFIEITSRPKSAENNTVRIWLIDEIESRFEDVQKAIYDFYAQEVEDGLTYDERLIKFIKQHVKA